MFCAGSRRLTPGSPTAFPLERRPIPMPRPHKCPTASIEHVSVAGGGQADGPDGRDLHGRAAEPAGRFGDAGAHSGAWPGRSNHDGGDSGGDDDDDGDDGDGMVVVVVVVVMTMTT